MKRPVSEPDSPPMLRPEAPECTEDLCPPPREEAELLAVATSDPDLELAALTKAVGHPVRIQILRLLADREECVCGDLVEALPLAQSTVSQHLKILKEAGLIRGEIDPPRVCYCLEPAGMRRLKTLVGSL